jgi:uncharacterized membrane protein YgcG
VGDAVGAGAREHHAGAGQARGQHAVKHVDAARLARAGVVFTRTGSYRVTHRKYRKDRYPLDTNCGCYTCRNFSRMYLHHLLKSKEVLGSMLMVLHNLAFYLDLMEMMRDAISENRFEEFRLRFHATYTIGDARSNLPPESLPDEDIIEDLRQDFIARQTQRHKKHHGGEKSGGKANDRRGGKPSSKSGGKPGGPRKGGAGRSGRGRKKR